RCVREAKIEVRVDPVRHGDGIYSSGTRVEQEERRAFAAISGIPVMQTDDRQPEQRLPEVDRGGVCCDGTDGREISPGSAIAESLDRSEPRGLKRALDQIARVSP